MKKELTCIGCPMGCRLTAEVKDGTLTISGNTCPRGEAYARAELTAPTRMVTALMPLAGTHAPLTVKTAAPIPKARIFDCLAAIKSTTATKPVRSGEVVLPNVCGTGVDVVATQDAY